MIGYKKSESVDFKGFSALQEYSRKIGERLLQAVSSVMTFLVNDILLGVSTTAVAFFGGYYKLQNFLMMPVNGNCFRLVCVLDCGGGRLPV